MPSSRSSARFIASVDCSELVPVFGMPMWRTVRIVAARRPGTAGAGPE
jgi:hypothetical protein